MIKQFLTFEGHLKRLKFFQLSLKLYIVVTILLAGAIAVGVQFGKWAIPLFVFTFAIAAAGNLSLTARRLTDLGLAKWWAVPISTLLTIGPLWVDAETPNEGVPIVDVIVIVSALLVQFWLFFRKGSN